MNTGDLVTSRTFTATSLRSERIRILAMLWVLGALFALLIVRQIQGDRFPFGLYLLINALIVYEVTMFIHLRDAIRANRPVAGWVSMFNVVIESLFPAVGIWIATKEALLGPYRALVAPVALIFFLFIILSTLRLRPLLSLFTGRLRQSSTSLLPPGPFLVTQSAARIRPSFRSRFT